MTFNLETWREQAAQKLQQIGVWLDRRRQDLPYVVYSTVAGLTLWPLVEAAAQTGQFWPVVGAMYSVVGNIGGNLIAEQLQRRKDKGTGQSAEDIAEWVQQNVAVHSDLRQALDAILLQLEAVPTAQAALDEVRRAQFLETLRVELSQLGNLAHFEAVLTGSGAVALGQGNTVLGERAAQAAKRAVVITGNNSSVQTIINQYGQGAQLSPDPAALQQQIGHYLIWLLDWAGTVELRGIQRQGEQVVQLPLEKVYVPLTAFTWRQDISLSTILTLGKRLIVTGGPGCGKTTVLLHVAWSLARAIAADDPSLAASLVGFPTRPTGDSLEGELLPLPIYVPLSLYAVHRRGLKPREDKTLATFISHYLFARQTSFNLPPDFFRHLLRQGRSILLLLDGLDEVPNEAERAQVRQAIEDLVTGREQMRVVATCRTAAYGGQTALGKGFQEVAVKPLSEAHIESLVEQAYGYLYRTDPLRQRQKTTELLQGIARLEAERRERLGKDSPRLIDSPLLVRMLLIVHYRERRLPEQRAELYMKATDAMLLPDYAPDAETAMHIGGLVGGSWEVHRDLVQHLAFHLHRRGEQQGREIEEADLRKLLQAEAAYAPLVNDFIALTRLRGTLLEERLGRYRFLHLAFQEFLTARYLAEIVRSEGGVNAIAALLEAGPVADSWWREVTLLLVGYFAVTSPQTAQAFLERLAYVDGEAAARPDLPLKIQLDAAELAAIAWQEWPEQRQALRQKLAERLAALLMNERLAAHAPPSRRAAAGRTLSLLGDPRPGVGCVRRDGQRIPDIVWGEEVPAGTYTIGGDKYAYRNFDKRSVQIKWPYRLSRYPVTHAQFQCFLDAPDFNDDGWWAGMPARVKDWSELAYPVRELGKQAFPFANHPRERVSWYQAVAFCRWLSVQLGYAVELPHEYEWEVAARWSDNRFYPWGNDWDSQKANTGEGGVESTTAVGLYPAGRNAALELYDLSGNVWEWCRNKYELPDDDRIDGSEARRVLRGGAWSCYSYFARATSRDLSAPAYRNSDGGFRLVRVRRPPSH